MIRTCAALLVVTAIALPAAAQTPPPAPTPALGAADAAQIVSVIDRVCIPIIGGAKASAVASAVGMRTNRDGDMVMQLEGSGRITVSPPSESNPTVCTMTALYDIGGDGAVYDALNGWAHARTIPYEQRRTRESSQVDNETHVTSTWIGTEGTSAANLVLIQEKRADGRSMTGRADQATILFSITPN